MARIFLSYRRSDGVVSGARSLIYQKLQKHYGAKSVFMDVERMEVARDFRECLQQELSHTEVMLVLIGPEWAGIMQQRGGDENDFVRIEIETALRLEKPVMPLLVGGAQMPDASLLPDSIKAFTFVHGVELDTGRFFNEGMSRLCADLDEHIFKGRALRKKLNRGLKYAAITAVIVMLISFVAIRFHAYQKQHKMRSRAAEVNKVVKSPVEGVEQQGVEMSRRPFLKRRRNIRAALQQKGK